VILMLEVLISTSRLTQELNHDRHETDNLHYYNYYIIDDHLM